MHNQFDLIYYNTKLQHINDSINIKQNNLKNIAFSYPKKFFLIEITSLFITLFVFYISYYQVKNYFYTQINFSLFFVCLFHSIFLINFLIQIFNKKKGIINLSSFLCYFNGKHSLTKSVGISLFNVFLCNFMNVTFGLVVLAYAISLYIKEPINYIFIDLYTGLSYFCFIAFILFFSKNIIYYIKNKSKIKKELKKELKALNIKKDILVQYIEKNVIYNNEKIIFIYKKNLKNIINISGINQIESEIKNEINIENH